MAPSATGVMPVEPQPSCRDSSRTSQSLSEPLVVTPIFLPLRSSGFWMSGAAPTIKPMLNGSLASAPTALAGTPLAKNPMAGPEPRPKSTAFATIPCCNFASPAKMTVSTSRSCFAQMPSAVPISTGAKANGWLTDLPTRTVSAAAAADAAPKASDSNNAAHMRYRSNSTPLGLVVIAAPWRFRDDTGANDQEPTLQVQFRLSQFRHPESALRRHAIVNEPCCRQARPRQDPSQQPGRF